MARGWSRGRVLAAAAVLALGALLAWAWLDGGERPIRPLSEPATLPEPGR